MSKKKDDEAQVLAMDGVSRSTICKACFDCYQRHQEVLHLSCYLLLNGNGVKDVRAPNLRKKMPPKSC